jgi:hypothetical protein
MSSILEFPPTTVPSAKSWTKDTTDTIVGIGGTTYVKYKTTLTNQTYGNGEYVAWANDIYSYTAGATYGANEEPASGAFDKLTALSASQPGWNSALATYNSTSDSATPAILYLKCPVALILKYYSIQAGGGSGWNSKAPSKWDLLGSMDGNYWSLIESKSSVNGWTLNEIKTYNTSNITPYSYYQLKMYRNDGDSGGYLLVGDLRYYGFPYPIATQSGMLEFPPTSVPGGGTWTKDLADTITGIGSVVYAKYKTTLSGLSYGNGQYIAFANSIWDYSATTGWGNDEWPASGAFDKLPSGTLNRQGWHVSSTVYLTNAADASPTPKLYLTCPTSFILRYYTLQSRSDGAQTQAPSSWKVWGSLDGTSLSVLVDTQTSQTGWTAASIKSYYTNNLLPFSTYIIEILRNNSGTADYTHIAELRYYGTMNMPTEGAVLEFPPPLAIGTGTNWTKDTTETITGISGSQASVNLAKYKYIVPPTHPYGTGEYQSWANSIYSYTNSAVIGTNEWCPAGAFDKREGLSNTNSGWASFDGTTYTNAADASPAPELYIKLPTRIFLTQYNIKSNSETGGGNGVYNPTKWKVWGSNNGSSWTLIDYVPSDTSWGLAQEKQYPTYSNVAYQYYKLTCMRINSASGVTFVISEWRLYGIMYNVGLNTTQAAILEYPPPVGTLYYTQWTTDTNDLFIGTSASGAPGFAYSKYKFTTNSTIPYGQGEYAVWASNILWTPNACFEKSRDVAWSTNPLWNNTSDLTYTADLYIKLPQNILLLSYGLLARNEIGNGIQCAPTKWILYGSKDNINWFILDSRTGENNSPLIFTSTRYYTVSTRIGSYNYFKFSVSRNNYASAVYVQLNNFYLYGIPETSTSNLEILEYPPLNVPSTINWIKDSTDTFVGIGPTTYYRYKTQVNGAPYGNGQYIAWANSILQYTAGTTYTSNEWPPSGAFDKIDTANQMQAWASKENTMTSLVDSITPPELYIQLPNSIILKYYMIHGNEVSITLTPSKWNIFGSIDGSTWMRLDSRDNETSWTSGESRIYTIDRGNTIAYNYYKLTIYRNNNPTAQLTAIGEWRLFGCPQDAGRMFEFPPPNVIGTITNWVQDTNDSFTALDASTYYKFKNIVPSSHSYGSGEYVCWTNSYLGGYLPPVIFDPNIGVNLSYVSALGTYSNTADANPAPEIFIRLPVAIALRQYIIMARNESLTTVGALQTISKWRLYGSNDEVVWILLDSRDSETNWSIAENRMYLCNNTTVAHTNTYKTFKLTLLRNNYSTNTQMIFGKWRLFGVPSISTALTTTNISFKSTMQDVHYQPDNLYAVIDISGLVGWFKGETWTGSRWTDISGAGNHATTIRGTISTKIWPTNGMKYLYGDTVSGLQFPSAILPTTYTLFHVTRYNGTTRQRIFDGVGGNFLSGFHGGHSGVAYHNGTWITQSSVDTFGNAWVVSTDQNNMYRGQGINQTIGTPTGCASSQISINHGTSQSTEPSDWAVAEVMVYNRTLTATEYGIVEAYLMAKWYNTISIKQSPNLTMSMPEWMPLQNDIFSMPSVVGWYRGDTWRNSIWFDASGNNNHAVTTTGTINVAPFTDRNGLLYLYGNTSAGIRFPVTILPNTYTLFYVAKYTSSTYQASSQRIFDGYGTNWLSGFKEGYSGSFAYHVGYSMGNVNTDITGNNWTMGCDQKRLFRSQGITRGSLENINPSLIATTQLSINYGRSTTETSNWAVAEVIVFEREMSINSIKFVENYLSNKYLIERTVPIPIYPGFKTSKGTWRYNMMDITNLLTASQNASRSGATLSLVGANTAMNYGCAVFPFTYTTPGNTYTVESEVLISSSDATIAKNAMWLGIGNTFNTSRYSWEHDQTGGYNMVTTLNSDYSAVDTANTFDVVATNFRTFTQPAYNTGLVIWYTFNSANISSNVVSNATGLTANNGTITSGTYSTLDNQTPFGSGIRVTARNFSCTLATTISTGTISGACWYYLDAFGSHDWSTVFGRTGGNYHHMILNGDTYKIGFYYSPTLNFVDSGISLYPGKWYHLAFTVSGSNGTYRLYINGIYVWSSSSFFDNANSGMSLGIIGNYQSGGTQGCLGILADVRVYNTCLTDENINDIYMKTASFQQALVSRQPLNAAEVIVPPIAMNADAMPILTATYGNGIYTAASSGTYDGTFKAWHGFNTGTSFFWASPGGSKYSVTTGVYSGSSSSVINGATFNGEWLQIQLPMSFRVKTVTIIPAQAPVRVPNRFHICGSNDGTNFYSLKYFDGIGDWASSVSKTFTINASMPYLYLRIAVSIIGNTGSTSRSDLCYFNMTYSGYYDNITNTIYSQTEVVIPPVGMTAMTTDLSTAQYAAGSYIASSSTSWPGTGLQFMACNAFDRTVSDGSSGTSGNCWWSGQALYSSTTNLYTGTLSTTVSGTAQFGEWLQIQLPYKLKLTRYEMYGARPYGNGYTQYAPSIFILAGSTDGSNWFTVDSKSGVTDWKGLTKMFVVNSTIAYNYYRMIIKANGNGTGGAECGIELLNLYGYTEDLGWRVMRHYVDLNKRKFRMTIPSQNVDVSADIPSSYLTNTGTQLGFAARTDTHYAKFQMRFCKIFSGWQEFSPLHLPYIDLDAMNLTKLQPGVQIGLWRNSGLEGGVSDAVAYNDTTTINPTMQLDAMGQPYVHFERSAKQFFMIPGTLRFLFRADDMTPIGGITVISVMRFNGSAGQAERVIEFQNHAANTVWGNSIAIARINTTSTFGMYILNDTSQASADTANMIDTSWHIYIHRMHNTTSGSTSDSWLDGNKLVPTSGGSAVLTKNTTTFNYIAKSNYVTTTGAYLQADMRELLIYRMPLSNETIGTVTSHLQNKWSLWKNTKMCVAHFDATYLGTVAGIAVNGNVTTWRNLGDDNTVIDATGAGTSSTYPTLKQVNGYYHVAFDRTYSQYLYLNGTLEFGDFMNGTTPTNGFTAIVIAQFTGTAGSWERLFDFGTGTPSNNIILSRSGIASGVSFSCYNTTTLALQYNIGLSWKAYSGYFGDPTNLDGRNDDVNWFVGRSYDNTGLSTNFTDVLTATNSQYTKGMTLYSIEWRGYFLATVTGTWTFYVNTDDASYLWIGPTALSGYTVSNTVAKYAGLHGATTEQSGTISLTAGVYYPIRFMSGQNSGGAETIMGVMPPSGTKTYDMTGYVFPIDFNTLDMTQWHMYTISFTNANNATVNAYIDGQLVEITKSTNTTAIANKSLTTNYIGRSCIAGDSYFTGNIRELIMYRTALSSTELSNLHTTLIKKWGLTDTPPAPIYKICHFDANDLASSLVAGQAVSSWTNKADDVMMFPPAAMTSASTNLSSATWGKGTYVASASTFNATGWDAYMAFNMVLSDVWATAGSRYTGQNQNANVLTTIGGASYYGEWLQLQMPQAISLKYYSIQGETNNSLYSARSPNIFYLAGSNDGTTWALVDSRTGVNDWTSSAKIFTCNSTTAYLYYRIILNKIGNSGGDGFGYAAIQEMKFYGNQEVVWPPAAMTSDATTLSGQNYGNGVYNTTVSSGYGGYTGFYAFNNNTGDFWHSNLTYTDTTGAYPGSASTIVSGTTYSGEWLQIQIPIPIKMTYYSILPRQDGGVYIYRCPNIFCIAGSMDGNTWTLIDSKSGIGSWGLTAQSFVVNSTNYYSYYRICVNVVGNTGQASGRNSCQIAEWDIYGIVPFTNYQPTVFNAVQATSANQPTLQSEDGLYHVNFNRTLSQYLQINTSLDFNTFQNYTTAQNGITAVVVGRMTNSSPDERFFDFGNGTNADNIVFADNNTSNGLYFRVLNGASVITSITPINMSDITNWHIYTVVISNATNPIITVYCDGNLITTYTILTNTILTNRITTLNYIGKSNWSDPYLTGGIREMIIYKQALSTGDLTNLHWSLMKKWRIVNTTTPSLTRDLVLSNKALHFDANDLVYSMGLTAGNNITTWRNLGTDGARLDATGYGGSSTKPTLQQEGRYWHVNLSIANSQYFQITGSIPFNHFQDGHGNFTGGLTITGVFRMTTSTNDYGRILHLSTAIFNINMICLTRNYNVDSYGSEVCRDNAGRASGFVANNSNQGISSWHVVTYVVINGSPPQNYIYVDGLLTTISITGPGTNITNRITTLNYIGTSGNAERFDGDIRELIIYRNALSQTELNSLHSQLMNKWGLAVNYDKFPSNLTANSCTISGIPFVASASTEKSTLLKAWYAFDGNAETTSVATTTSWQSASAVYDTSGNSTATPALGTDDAYGGQWVQIQFAYGVIPKYYTLGGDALTWRIYGSPNPYMPTNYMPILSAYYGIANYAYANVTTIVINAYIAYLAGGQSYINAGYGNFGDPVGGQVKTLYVNYMNNDTLSTFTTGEGGNFDFNTVPRWSPGTWTLLDERSITAMKNWTDVNTYQIANAVNDDYYAFAIKIKKSAMFAGSTIASIHTLNFYGTQSIPYNIFSPDIMGYFTTGSDVGQWQTIYETTSGIRDVNGNTVYSQRNDESYNGTFSRVAYYMQNNMGNGKTTYWAFVSFDAWNTNISTYRLPNVNDTFTIQSQTLTNMNIYSNHPQVTARTGCTGLANIWPWDYAYGSGQSTYNYLNTSTGNTSYGAFQIYDMTTTNTVFSWNGHSASTIPHIGFGNNNASNINYTSVGSLNWTAAVNGAYNFKLKVMVR